MKHIPWKTAKGVAWGLMALTLGAALVFGTFPAARLVSGILLAVLFAALLAFLLVCCRCPACGALLRLDDKFCSQCGARLEE